MTMAITGGCQCGDVRFRADAPDGGVELCHCSMCRRAVGNIHMTSLSVPRGAVHWEGSPRTYASSPVATRGFCARCGTPLFFAYDASDKVDLMVGAIDQAAELHPDRHYGIESRLNAFRALDGLPEERTDEVIATREYWAKSVGRSVS